MKYNLYYNKVTGKMIDLTPEVKNYNNAPYIVVTEEDKEMVYENIKSMDCFVVDGVIIFLEPKFDTGLKREEVVAERDTRLKCIDPCYTDRYKKYLSSKGVDTAAPEYKEANDNYYTDVMGMVDSYDACTDKRNWKWVEVDIKSETLDSEVHEIVRPAYIKRGK